MVAGDSENRIRLDKWLWAARFFKTRALAVAAVAGGKVHAGGQRVKPAHAVRVGEVLSIPVSYTHLDVYKRQIHELLKHNL